MRPGLRPDEVRAGAEGARVMAHDWLVRLTTRAAGSVHYMPKEEAERIAANARGIEGVVAEGPRPLSPEEKLSPKDRAVVCYNPK